MSATGMSMFTPIRTTMVTLTGTGLMRSSLINPMVNSTGLIERARSGTSGLDSAGLTVEIMSTGTIGATNMIAAAAIARSCRLRRSF